MGPELGEGVVLRTLHSPMGKPSAFGASVLPLLLPPLPLGTTALQGGEAAGQTKAVSTPTPALLPSGLWLRSPPLSFCI